MDTYMITGGTGFIGHMIADELLKEADVKVVLPVRNMEKAKGIYGDNDRITFVDTDLEHMSSSKFDMDIDFIIHTAATTTSKIMVEKPVEVADGMVNGTRNVLEVAKDKKVKKMVYLSSMEAFGSVPDDGKRRSEEETGYISLTSPRSCYPLGKQMAELMCALYVKEYQVPVTVARLSQVFGKGVQATDTRVFMQFARAAKEKNDIVLKTPGMSYGNYTATEDAVSAILFLIKNGENGETYNIVNEANTMRIRDMAKLVCDESAGGQIQVRIETDPNNAYAADTGLQMSGKKLKELGFAPTKTLKDMYMDLMEILRGEE